VKKWATIAEVSELSRQRILDANDLLDAIEEAEAEASKGKEK